MTLKPINKTGPGRYELNARVRSLFGPKLYSSVKFSRSYCVDTPDPHFSVILLEKDDGTMFSLWFWGEDGIPQHNDRLMGYASFSDSKVQNSKVALWYK